MGKRGEGREREEGGGRVKGVKRGGEGRNRARGGRGGGQEG